jgi:hypothetical protein
MPENSAKFSEGGHTQGKLTPDGWQFLIKLLHKVGYVAWGRDGLVVSRKLCEDLHAALNPTAPRLEQIKDSTSKENRQAAYRSLTERFKRLEPGHRQETAGEDTLLALSKLAGFSDPQLFDMPDIGPLLRELAGADPYTIDFLRFRRKLTVAGALTAKKDDKNTYTAAKPETTHELLNDKPRVSRATMYLGAVTFMIAKSFTTLQLVPQPSGLRFLCCPIEAGMERTDVPGYIDIVLPLETIGGFLSTAIAFLERKECLDENIILQGADGSAESDCLFKLYRDKPQGADGKLSGAETCWFRIVTGPAEQDRRRILLSPRDLICLIEACRLTAILAASFRTHEPKAFDASTIHKTVNPELMKRLEENIKNDAEENIKKGGSA